MTHPSPCRFLGWDSEFFGRRIARVDSARLTPEEVERVRRWARAEAIECLYYLADAADTESIRVAEDAGFRITDTRVTRERSLDREGGELPEGVELFREEDVPELRAIAGTSHGASRFYHDRHFPRERCDALYETWIANACTGDADCVLVVRSEARAVGYLTCVIESPTTGRIGLTAVAAAERGQRFGERLVRGSLRWLAGHGCERVLVASQARNLEAARLYERLGFQTIAAEHWYHLWPPAGEGT
jgi:dTDP-4-amino-4,6-dideoxy-D-galactose acyltransferase